MNICQKRSARRLSVWLLIFSILVLTATAALPTHAMPVTDGAGGMARDAGNAIGDMAESAELPIVEVKCPADGNTERARMKEYLDIFEREHRGLYHRIMGAIQRGEVDGFHIDLINNEEKKRRKELKANPSVSQADSSLCTREPD